MPDWFAAAAASVDAGVLLVIDYALEAQRYFLRRSDGTLMAVCAQQAGLSPLDQPGEQDSRPTSVLSLWMRRSAQRLDGG